MSYAVNIHNKIYFLKKYHCDRSGGTHLLFSATREAKAGGLQVCGQLVKVKNKRTGDVAEW